MSKHQVKLNKTATGVLQGARDLLADPARWTQRVLARSADGASENPVSPNAACWCAIGAIARAAHDQISMSHPQAHTATDITREDARYVAHVAFEEACNKLHGSFIASYVNDNLGHPAVLAGFDEAITKLKSTAAAKYVLDSRVSKIKLHP